MKGISNPLTSLPLPQAEEVRDALNRCIVSSSGIRTVFAAKGGENSRGKAVSVSNLYLAATLALAFSDFIKEKNRKKEKVIVFGTDSRPTGSLLASVMAWVFTGTGITLRYLGIVPSPEIMAYAKNCKEVDAFAYITASHNPPGHNGFKCGLRDGGVLGAEDSEKFNNLFLSLARDPGTPEKIFALTKRVKRKTIKAILDKKEDYKREAEDLYHHFLGSSITGYYSQEEQEGILSLLSKGARENGLGVVVDFNGSSRCNSIDQRFLSSLGIKVTALNDTAGKIAHTIIPEGRSLKPCARRLQEIHSEDPSYVLGYVPDNDGDRGNLVYFDETLETVVDLPAQRLFALAELAELSYLVYSGLLTYDKNGKAEQKVAVVVNGPTSLRVERIAELFDVRVFRAEVGEANVVELARDLRHSGFIVRIFGEGSNGGTIIYPSAVRDPLNTLGSFFKLMLLPPRHNMESPFGIWCRRSGQMDKYRDNPTLSWIISTLPQFLTTGVAEKRAVVQINSQDPRVFKEKYEERFLIHWDKKKRYLKKRYGIHSWEEINYEGKQEIHGFGRDYRNTKARGGLKILFKNEKGKKIAFIWMRGSGTEPVFRVLADVEGQDKQKEHWLLAWHKQMIREADI